MDYHKLIQQKIKDANTLVHDVFRWKFFNKKVVFTNGCFDILHAGHVDYLSKARSLGDALVVGLNTDASVKRQGKSPERPINNQDARARVLASLLIVDAVVLFDEDTPYELIKLVQPDVLVKGADYNPENIVGADIVKANGGEVVTIELTPGYSTTGILASLKQ